MVRFAFLLAESGVDVFDLEDNDCLGEPCMGELLAGLLEDRVGDAGGDLDDPCDNSALISARGDNLGEAAEGFLLKFGDSLACGAILTKLSELLS